MARPARHVTVTITNVAPTAAFSVDHTTDEGELITFSGDLDDRHASDLPLLTYA